MMTRPSAKGSRVETSEWVGEGDEGVGDHELGGRDPGRVHPQAPQHRGEAEFFPRLEGDELGTKLDDVFRFDAFEDDAVDGIPVDCPGAAGASRKRHDAGDLLGGHGGESGFKPIRVAFETSRHGTGDEGFFAFGNVGVPEGGDDSLTWLPLRVAVGFDELHEGRAFDDFGPKIHKGDDSGAETLVNYDR